MINYDIISLLGKSTMTNRKNPLKIQKNLIRTILLFVGLIFIFTIILFAYSALSEKKTSVKYKNTSFLQQQVHRRFQIESTEDKIYNLGEYQVNLTANKFLILDLSVNCAKESYDTFLDNNILIQNAVLEAFSTYGDIPMPTSRSGKETIKKRLIKNINDSLRENLVQEIYFKKYLIQ